MRVQRWHWGKLVILWAWGGLLVALLVTRFVTVPADQNPLVSALSFLGSLVILFGLTAITWRWLGGKDAAPPGRPQGGGADGAQ